MLLKKYDVNMFINFHIQIICDRRKVEIETAYTTNQQTEQELSKTLTDKYGAGNLNPETGEFTPNENN